MLDWKELHITGNKIFYRGSFVGSINDMDMSKERFEFEDFLKALAKGKLKYESK